MAVKLGTTSLVNFMAGSHQVLKLMAGSEKVWPMLQFLPSQQWAIRVNRTLGPSELRYASIAEFKAYAQDGSILNAHHVDYMGSYNSSYYVTGAALTYHSNSLVDSNPDTFWVADERHSSHPTAGVVLRVPNKVAYFDLTVRKDPSWLGRTPIDFDLCYQPDSHRIDLISLKHFTTPANWQSGETRTFYL